MNKSVQQIQKLANTDGSHLSPIDISLSQAKPVDLTKLSWTNFEDVPVRMRLTNTGDTLIFSAMWNKERPYISAGPLDSKFMFSQLHFHWGAKDSEGSEHKVDGSSYPLEMHAVYFKDKYGTLESAIKEKDGMVVICYFFKIDSKGNSKIQNIVDAASLLRQSHSYSFLKPLKISSICTKFEDDYFVYWGSFISPLARHTMLHIICRETLRISKSQMDTFRGLMNGSGSKKHTSNSRGIQPLGNRTLFHVNPSTKTKSTLLPIKDEKLQAKD